MNFLLDIFIEVLLVFNFILQSKFIIYYFLQFHLDSYGFFFYLFVKVIILLNLALKLEIYCCPQFFLF